MGIFTRTSDFTMSFSLFEAGVNAVGRGGKTPFFLFSICFKSLSTAFYNY